MAIYATPENDGISDFGYADKLPMYQGYYTINSQKSVDVSAIGLILVTVDTVSGVFKTMITQDTQGANQSINKDILDKIQIWNVKYPQDKVSLKDIESGIYKNPFHLSLLSGVETEQITFGISPTPKGWRVPDQKPIM